MNDLRNVPVLDEQLNAIERQIDRLREEAREIIANAPITDEIMQRSIDWYGPDRYILIRPDGAPAVGFPYRYGGLSWSQRPAAMRGLRRSIPGTRLLDKRLGQIITQDETEEA